MAPRRIWAKKGSKPIFYYQGEHIRCNALGAVCPSSGDFTALLMPRADTEIFQMFLDYLNKEIKDKKICLVMDNASWHKAETLNWGNITPIYLPPYSPDFNPIEELWKVIKDRLFDIYPSRTFEQHFDKLQDVMRQLFNNKNEVKSICKLNY